MNAHDLTFGVEFETTMPFGVCPVGSYQQGAAVEWLPAGWVAKTDCSIRATGSRQGVEFVSPVLKGEDGVKQVLEVLTALKLHGARVNESTGLHVHVGGFDMTTVTIERLTTLVANFEKAIYASTGTTKRESGRWCQSVQRHGSYQGAATSPFGSVLANRYHVLNLTNVNRPTKKTVEFRAFAGTLNETKVIGHLQMCLGLVDRAINAKRTTQWKAIDPKESSPIHRSGVGQTALTRLFYQLGWTKGRTDKTYGVVPVEGAPSIEAIKKELMRLAKQYDAMGNGGAGR